MIGVYVTRDFKVTIMLTDNQFEPMLGDLIDLYAQHHITSQGKHVPEIDQYNCTSRDSVYNIIPFDYMTPIMVIEMVYADVFWCNMFALKGGISKTQSPYEIILNRKLKFNTHCKVECCEYVQTHEEHNNTMQSCTIGDIATRPRNDGGGSYFISLSTRRHINHRTLTSMPMPSEVVA